MNKAFCATLLFLFCSVPLSFQHALAQYPTKILYGADAYAGFGHSLASGYDLDSDGFFDIAVGAPLGLQGRGRVRVIRHTGDHIAWLQGAGSLDRFGTSVASPGDLNGDGYPDLLVGAPGTISCSTGGSGSYVKAFLGPAFTAVHYTVTGGTSEAFGTEMKVIGDINADGINDFIVGSPFARLQSSQQPCSLRKGEVQVISGSSGAQIYSYIGSQFGDSIGRVMGGVGDVNNDGTPDFAYSTGFVANGPYTKVYSGLTGSLLYSLSFPASNGTKSSISPLGDVNADGYDDFILSDMIGVSPTFNGAVRVIDGSNGSVLYTKTVASPHTFFGVDSAAIGDIDSDGVPDFIASSFDFNNGPPGIIKVFSGALGTDLGTISLTQTGNLGFAHTLATIGDVNSDGVVDFVAGAPAHSHTYTQEGSVFIFQGPFGRPTPPGGATFYHHLSSTVILSF